MQEDVGSVKGVSKEWQAAKKYISPESIFIWFMTGNPFFGRGLVLLIGQSQFWDRKSPQFPDQLRSVTSSVCISDKCVVQILSEGDFALMRRKKIYLHTLSFCYGDICGDFSPLGLLSFYRQATRQWKCFQGYSIGELCLHIFLCFTSWPMLLFLSSTVQLESSCHIFLL